MEIHTTKVAAIIIAYHPDLINLKRNVQQIINSVDYLIVWRNSSDDLSILNETSDNVLIWGDGTNQYIAHPLNVAIDWCISNKIDYLLTMDQDSTWKDCTNFLHYALSLKFNNVGIFAPRINTIKSFYKGEYEDIETTITSGSLVNVKIAKEVGGFNEKYQIYWVDGEFCYKLRKNNYRIIRLNNHELTHKLGNPTKTFLGFETSNYSPIVYYFLIRNMIWEHRQYGSSAVSYKCMLYTLFTNVRGIILGEKHKFQKLRKITLAIYHGLLFSYQ